MGREGGRLFFLFQGTTTTMFAHQNCSRQEQAVQEQSKHLPSKKKSPANSNLARTYYHKNLPKTEEKFLFLSSQCREGENEPVSKAFLAKAQHTMVGRTAAKIWEGSMPPSMSCTMVQVHGTRGGKQGEMACSWEAQQCYCVSMPLQVV